MPYLVGYITPQDYGAMGNGSNDDTAAINSALAAVATNGQTVLFPPGQYKITSTLAPAVNGTIIMGTGWGSQIQYDGSVATTAIAPTGNIRCFLRDIRISQTNASHLGTTLDWSGCNTSAIERVLVDGGGASGVSPLVGIKFNAATCHYNVVRDSRIGYGGASSTGITILASSHANTIDNTRFIPQSDDVNSSGIYITNTHSTTIIRSDVESAAGNGLFLDTAAHGTMMFNPYCDTNNINLKISNGVIAPSVFGGTLQGGITANIQDNGSVAPVFMNAWPNSGSTTFSEVALSAARAAGNVLTVTNTTGAPTGDNVLFVSQSAADSALGVRVTGDTVDRLTSDSNGKLQWGAGGASALDTNLYRSAAGILKTDFTLQAAVNARVAQNLQVGSLTALGDNGVGEIQLSDAGTKPTSAPTAGTVIFSQSGAPLPLVAFTPNGFKQSLVDALFVLATNPTFTSASQTATTLALAVEGSATYLVELVTIFSNTTGTTTYSWTGPTGATMQWNDTTASLDYTSTIGGTGFAWPANAGTRMAIHKGVLFTSATAGTLTLTVAVSAGTTTLNSGSYLRLTRMK